MSASQVENDLGGQWNESKPWIQTFNGSAIPDTISFTVANFSSKNETFSVVLDSLSNSTEANIEYSAWNVSLPGMFRGNIQGYDYVYYNNSSIFRDHYQNDSYIVSEYNSYVIIIHNRSNNTFLSYVDALKLMATQISDM